MLLRGRLGDLFLEAGKADAIPVKLNVALVGGAAEDEPPKLLNALFCPKWPKSGIGALLCPLGLLTGDLGGEFGTLFSMSKYFGEKT